MFPKVVQVIPQIDYSVYVYFEDGKIVHYNVEHMLHKEIFQPLNNIDFFMKACTVLNDTLAWDIDGSRNVETCIDIAPDTLYELPAVAEEIA